MTPNRFLIFFLIFFPAFLCGASLELSGPGEVSPKSVATISYTLTNDQDRPLTFAPTLSLPENWKSITPLTSIPIAPNATKKGWINVAVPRKALAGINHKIGLTLTQNEGGPSVSAFTEVQINETEVYSASLLPHQTVLWEGERLEVMLLIRNDGNVEQELDLLVTPVHPWELSYAKKTPLLKPGESCTLPIRISAPTSLSDSEENFFITYVKGSTWEKRLHFRLMTIPESSSASSPFYPMEHSLQTTLFEIGEGGVPKTQFLYNGLGQSGEHASYFFEGTGTFFGKDEKGAAFREEYFTLEFLNPDHSKITLGQSRRQLTYLTNELQGNGIDLYGESRRFRGIFYYAFEDNERDSTYTERPHGASLYTTLGEKSEVGLHYVDYQSESTGSAFEEDDRALSFTAYHSGSCHNFESEVAKGMGKDNDSKGIDFRASYFPEDWLFLGEYRDVDNAFPGKVSNHKGYRLMSSRAFSPSFSLWSEFVHYRTNPENDPDFLTETRHRYVLGGNYNKAGYLPKINLSAEREGKTTQNTPDYTFSRIYRGRLNASQDILGCNFNLRGYWEQEKDHYTDQRLTDYNHQLFINKRIERFSALLRGNWQRLEERNAFSKSQVYEASGIYEIPNWGSLFGLFGIEWYRIPRSTLERSYRYEGGFLIEKFKERFEARYREKQITAWREGLKENPASRRVMTKWIHFFSKRHYLELFYEFEKPRSSSADHRLSVLYLYTFRTPGPFLRKNQAVTGRLYLADSNTPLEKQKVTLGGVSTYTDKQGRFEIRDLPPGSYKVEVDPANLDSGYQLGIDAKSLVTVEKGERTYLEIPVVATGKICGKVNVLGGPAPPREGFHLLLYRDQKLIKEGYTTPSGTFCLNDLEPGSYLLKLDRSTLTGGVEVTPEDGIEITLKSKESITGIEFSYREKERKLKIKKFGS